MALAFGSPGSNIGTNLGSVSGNAAALDGPPPHMPPRPAGADTRALLGDRPDSDVSGGSAAMSSFAQGIGAVAAILQGVQTIESLTPGRLTPQFLAEVEELQRSYPEDLKAMAEMQSPHGLLAMASSLSAGGGIGGPVPPNIGGMGMGMGAVPQLGQSSGVNGSRIPAM
jgi:hypothetical protein